jgi:thymidylate kinase
MIVVLEGPDGAGKSTAAEMLRVAAEEQGYSTSCLHRGPPKFHPLVEYEVGLGYIEQDYDVIICDRWHWGELVYGPIYRGESKLGTAGFRHVEMFLAARRALTVLMLPPLELLQSRVSERGDDYINHEHLPLLRQRYVDLVQDHHTDLQFVHYKFTEVDARAIIDQYRLRPRGMPVMHPSYIGHPPSHAKYLLVGDARAERHRGHRTAFTPYADSSGSFLLDALPSDLVSDIAIINANPDIDVAVDFAWDRIVALGGVASAELDARGVEHVHVRHPQFARRFHHRRQFEYGQTIADAITTGKDGSKWPTS